MSADVASAAVLIAERLVIPERIAFSLPVDGLVPYRRDCSFCSTIRKHDTNMLRRPAVNPGRLAVFWRWLSLRSRDPPACYLFRQRAPQHASWQEGVHHIAMDTLLVFMCAYSL